MEKQIVLTRESYDAKVKELEQLKTTGLTGGIELKK